VLICQQVMTTAHASFLLLLLCIFRQHGGASAQCRKNRPTLAYGVDGDPGACNNAGSSDGRNPGPDFDASEKIVIAGTLSMLQNTANFEYGQVMRNSILIFLDWINLERGGVEVGGLRKAMEFTWVGDGSNISEAKACAQIV
jgi:hypothetical protein